MFLDIVDSEVDYSHCTIQEYFPDGIPDDELVDPDWTPSVAPEGSTYEGVCLADPNKPTLVAASSLPDGTYIDPISGVETKTTTYTCGWSVTGNLTSVDGVPSVNIDFSGSGCGNYPNVVVYYPDARVSVSTQTGSWTQVVKVKNWVVLSRTSPPAAYTGIAPTGILPIPTGYPAHTTNL